MSYEIAGITPDPQPKPGVEDRAKGSVAHAQDAESDPRPLDEDVLLAEGVVLDDVVRGGDRPERARTKRASPKAGSSKPAMPKAPKAKSARPAKPTAAETDVREQAPRKGRTTPLTLVVSTPRDEPAPDGELDAVVEPAAVGTAAALEEPGSDDDEVLDEAEVPRRGRLARARNVLVGNFTATVLAVVAIGLAVALALTMVQLGNQNALNNARTSSLAAARTYSVEIAGYDYRHLGTDFGVVLANSTPSFRQSFTQSSNALKSTLTKYHATASAKVVAAAIVSATTSRAVILVFLDQTVMNSAQKAPTTDRSQVEITLVATNGKWLIDQVTLL